MAIQCGFLVSFPAKYKDEQLWYLASSFYLPSCGFWIYIITCGKENLFRFIVWTLYMWAGLLSNVIKIFGFVLDDIEKESSLTPQALKIVLCTTPHLLLLLVNTAKDSFDSDGNKELVAKLSVQIAIDLFDAVEMLDIFWTTKNTNSTFPKKHLDAMISVVWISFFL